MYRAGLALIVLLLFAAPAVAEKSVAELVAELGGPDAMQRSRAMTELRNRKDPRAIPLLVGALPDYEYLGQYYGVMVLEAYPQKLSEPALPSLVQAEAPYLRLAAATGVYRYGDLRAVPVIVKTLTLPDIEPSIRMYMLNRLNWVQDRKVLDAVRSLVVPGAEVTVIGAAMNLLGNMPDDASRSMAVNLLADPRPGVRAMALTLLYRMGEEHRAVEISEALRSGEVEYNEFIRIRSLLYPMPRVSAEILDAVLSLLEADDDTNTLSQGIGLIEKFRYRKAIPVLKKLLTHENRIVSKAAFEALSALGGGLDAEVLYPLLESEDVDQRLMAADALRKMDDLAGFTTLVEILKAGQDQQRADAAKALGGFRTPAAVEPLIAALLDSYSTTRTYAETSLLSVLRTLYPYRRFDLVTTGYQRDGPAARREQAVKLIRGWWAANR